MFLFLPAVIPGVLFAVLEGCEILDNVEARRRLWVEGPQPGVTLVSAAPGVEVLVLHQLVPEHEARVQVRVDCVAAEGGDLSPEGFTSSPR